jgi:type II secretory pathway pseudopilin PulG
MNRHRHAMTLPEIIVVIGLIMLLLGFIVPAGAMLVRAVLNLNRLGIHFGHH